MRVFLVGGEAYFSEKTRRVLNSEPDYEVIDGVVACEETIAAIEKSLPDVVILDIDCGNYSGLEIARRVKQSRPSVAVVLVAADYGVEQLLAALKSGANACLSKDASSEALLDVIRKAVQGEYPITQAILHPAVASRIIAEFALVSSPREGVRYLPARLLPLEAEILWHISNGSLLDKIVIDMHIAEDTVKQRLYTILGKLVANHRNSELTDIRRTG